MICFRDMTFCSAKCKNAECDRQFDAKQKAAAEKWWEGCDGSPPVAFTDFSPKCEEYKP